MTNVPTGLTGEAMSYPRHTLIWFHRTETARAALCPMLSLIRAYEAERARFNASDTYDGAHLDWLFDQLVRQPPPIYSEEGAQAALRLVADSLENEIGGFQEPLVAAALAYLRTERA